VPDNLSQVVKLNERFCPEVGDQESIGWAERQSILGGFLPFATRQFDDYCHHADPSRGDNRETQHSIGNGLRDKERFAIRASRPAAGFDRCYAPGELEHETELRYRETGIPLNAETLAGLAGCE